VRKNIASVTLLAKRAVDNGDRVLFNTDSSLQYFSQGFILVGPKREGGTEIEPGFTDPTSPDGELLAPD